MISRLDHVFGTKGVKLVGSPVLDTRTMLEKEPEEELTDRNTPSDHLPLIVAFEISP
jgi:TorA maturation chaperone TorD